jgi:hypothetical protein
MFHVLRNGSGTLRDAKGRELAERGSFNVGDGLKVESWWTAKNFESWCSPE